MRKILIAVLFLSAHVVHAGDPYLPLALENRWTYRSQFLISVNIFNETVTEETSFNRESYFVFDTFRLQTSAPFRVEGQTAVTFVEGVKYLMYDFAAETGTSWRSPDPPQSIMGQMTLVGKSDTVLTPAGAFVGCRHFRHYFGADMVYDEWFAPGVGIVKRNTSLLSGLIASVLIDRRIATAARKEPPAGAAGYKLHGNYPNPFNASTTISFEAPRGENLDIQVLDCRGTIVADLLGGACDEGLNRVVWNPCGQNSGVYLIRMRGSRFTRTWKAVLQK